MAQTRPCPTCGRPTSPVTGRCPSCDDGEPAESLPTAAAPLAAPVVQPDAADMLRSELGGFVELAAIFAPIGIAIVLIALGVVNLLALPPAFLLAMGIGAYRFRGG